MNKAGKLSRHVLGMKFMRRTKDQVDKEKTEATFRQHYSQEVGEIKVSRDKCEIIEVGSFSQVEGHIFGRQSFGGFNPTLESNVAKGIWRPFYLEPNVEENEEEDEISELEDGEVDVSDKEMSKTFGSLVGTLGKKFMKRKRGKPKVKQEANFNGNVSNEDTKLKWKGEGDCSKKEDDQPPIKKRKFWKPSN